VRSSLVPAGVALIATCYGFARFAYGLFAPWFTDEFALPTRLAGFVGGGGYVGYCRLAPAVWTVIGGPGSPGPSRVLSWTGSASGPPGPC